MRKSRARSLPFSKDAIPPRSIAVVSGKGGSGKTVVVAVLCEVLDRVGIPVLLVDADTGTGGLTYFMVVKIVRNATVGISDMVVKSSEPIDAIFERAVQRMAGFGYAEFLGIGDHRRFHNLPRLDVPRALARVIGSLPRPNSWRIFDCRGGIDAESLTVCGAVDDIVLIVEPDTTSFQATAHLVDVLSQSKLAHKVRGFIINKVFTDPTYVGHNGTSAFKSRHLASVPFDFEAMRSYLIGELPRLESPFGVHVWEAAFKLYPNYVPEPAGRIWAGKEFEEIGLTNLNSYRGGLLVAGLTFLLGILWAMNGFVPPTSSSTYRWLLPALGLLALIGSLDLSRRVLGRGLAGFVRSLSRLVRSENRVRYRGLAPPRSETASSRLDGETVEANSLEGSHPKTKQSSKRRFPVPTNTTCKLQPTPQDPNCAFKATPGAIVTLAIKEVTGGGFIDFETATYAGNAIPGTPGKQITFTVVAGQNDLIVVYVFSDPNDGRGELHEVCNQNTFLDTIRAASKTIAYTICA